MGVFQAVLSAGGIFAIAFYSVGWLYWYGYFGYFNVPMGAVDLGIADMALGAFPRFLPVIGVLAFMPIEVLLERWWRRRLERLQADSDAIIELAEDLTRRVEKATEDNNREQAKKLLGEFNALKRLDAQFRSRLPFRWLLPFRWALPLIGALAFPAGFGVVFLLSYLPDGLPSAFTMLPRTALALILTFTAFALAYHVWERRFNLRTVLFVVVVLIGIPASAWLDGQLSAYAAWHSDNRDAYFPTVVMYSESPLFDEWEHQSGGLYSSPELMLIRKAGGTYVVANEDEPDKITVIASDIITHVDYMR